MDQLPHGTFVVVSGPSASGKTTLARAPAPALLGVCTNDPLDVAPLVARIRAAAGMAA
jgi:ABC-type protease/lipase transport system fused ATPase/permease subunit